MAARGWCIATTVGIAPGAVNPQDEGCAGLRRASTTDRLRLDQQWRHELSATPLRGAASAGLTRQVRAGGLRRHVGRHPMAILGPVRGDDDVARRGVCGCHRHRDERAEREKQGTELAHDGAEAV